jgi:hypothetical protein
MLKKRKKMLLQVLTIVFFLTGTFLSPIFPAPADNKIMVGVKLYEYKEDFAGLFAEWKEMGINTAFVSVELAGTPAFMKLARGQGVAVFIILPVFYNPEALAKDPGLYAITGYGQPAKLDWVEFVCPQRPEFRRQRLDYIRELIRNCQPDGISIDFIRYFAFWEMVYPDAKLDPLQNTCFCPYCLQAFQKECRLTIPKQLTETRAKAEWILKKHLPVWAKWKRATITSMVRDIAAAARQEKNTIKLNVHLVPWRQKDFNGAMRTVVSQDITAIGPLVDYLSPMCYAHMVKQTADWTHSVVRDIHRLAANPVIPSIQVKEDYITETLTPGQFSNYLKEALKPPSRGVVFWSWETLATDAAKKEIARSLIISLKNLKK